MRFAETWTSATLAATRDLTAGIREFLLRPDAPIAAFAPGSHINPAVAQVLRERGLDLLDLHDHNTKIMTFRAAGAECW